MNRAQSVNVIDLRERRESREMDYSAVSVARSLHPSAQSQSYATPSESDYAAEHNVTSHSIGASTLLEVNGIRLSVAEALLAMDEVEQDHRLAHNLIDLCLIREALSEHPEMSLRTLRKHVAKGKVDAWFAEHRNEFDMMTCVWVTVPIGQAHPESKFALELTFNPLAAIMRARRQGYYGDLAEWRSAELPERFESLRDLPIGAVASIDVGVPALGVVLECKPAELEDNGCRDLVERRIFDEWLSTRRDMASVHWFSMDGESI